LNLGFRKTLKLNRKTRRQSTCIPTFSRYLTNPPAFSRWLFSDENQLVIVKKGSVENGGGTWLHPKLAIDFARWLSPDFAVWCDLQIEKILRLKTVPINSDLAEIFLKPITKSLTPDDFKWRYQVLATAFQHLENATMVKTFKGSELLVGKRLVKSKRIF
jgi:KilA-N domain